MYALPDKPVVLTIAGLDPSGCAGLLADIKTFEAHGVYGMAVCTANTAQNINTFKKANWIKQDEILNQLQPLQQEVSFEFVKIGLIKDLELLNRIVDALISKSQDVKIVWDPVCKASAQFVFHTKLEQALLETVFKKLYLITPNLEEQLILAPGMDVEQAGNYLSAFCNVLIKGGHSIELNSTDILFTKQGVHHFEAERVIGFSKRGTGCVLSSAIIANIARGESLVEACANAKTYVRNYLISNNTLVGTHSYAN